MQEENILIQAGLSQEQASVYDALLEKGPQKASDLASWTGIKRGLIYKVLEQLENMGLIDKHGGPGTVAVFSPSHPSNLLLNIEREQKELSMSKDMLAGTLGNFISKYNLIAGKPNVQFFEGEEAIKKITGDYPEEDKEIRQWIDIGSALEYIKEETLEYIDKRIKVGISKRMIVSDTVKNREYAKKGSRLTAFKVMQGELPTAIQVYDNTISMLTLSEKGRIGVMIEDSTIAQTMKTIFDSVWEKAENITPVEPSSVPE